MGWTMRLALLFLLAASAFGQQIKLRQIDGTGQTFNVGGIYATTGSPHSIPLDATSYIGRKTTASQAAFDNTQNALFIQHDFLGTVGTPWALGVFLTTPNLTSANGSAAIAGYQILGGPIEGLGVHGETDNSGVGAGVGVNAEVVQTAAAAGTIIATVSNVTPYSVGHLHKAYGHIIAMNYPDSTANAGWAQYIRGDSGKHSGALLVDETTAIPSGSMVPTQFAVMSKFFTRNTTGGQIHQYVNAFNDSIYHQYYVGDAVSTNKIVELEAGPLASSAGDGVYRIRANIASTPTLGLWVSRAGIGTPIANVPVNTQACTAGDFKYGQNAGTWYVFLCVSANTWNRAALTFAAY